MLIIIPLIIHIHSSIIRGNGKWARQSPKTFHSTDIFTLRTEVCQDATWKINVRQSSLATDVFWCLVSNQVLLFQTKLQCHKFYKWFDFDDGCHVTDRQTNRQAETWTISALLKRVIKLYKIRPIFSAEVPLKNKHNTTWSGEYFLFLSGTFSCDDDT